MYPATSPTSTGSHFKGTNRSAPLCALLRVAFCDRFPTLSLPRSLRVLGLQVGLATSDLLLLGLLTCTYLFAFSSGSRASLEIF